MVRTHTLYDGWCRCLLLVEVSPNHPSQTGGRTSGSPFCAVNSSIDASGPCVIWYNSRPGTGLWPNGAGDRN